MNVEGIFTTRVESTPNYNPAVDTFAPSNDSMGQRGNGGKNTTDTLTLSPEAQAQVRELQQRDSEVRAHEQAHVSAGGQYVRGGINYTYTRGPDNKQYATGGSVSLDTSPVAGDPEATIEKARILRSAALAPGNPSAQDQSVAAAASSMEAEARIEKTQEQARDQAQGQKNIPSVEQNNFVASFANVAEGRIAQNTMPQNAVNNTTFTTNHAILSLTDVRSVRSHTNNMDAALAAYKTQQRSAFVPSALAPWGTGISLQV